MAGDGARIRPEPGLYFISTPIGAARDITLRALDLLAGCDVLAAEDTRTLRHLMDIHGIALRDRPMIAYHDHNDAQASPRILAALAEGKSVAYASEAGTPLVSDPGYQLGRDVARAGFRVTAAPGPSAAIMALTLSGLPSDRFLFAGFAPSTEKARQSWLRDLATIKATLIFFESPNRIGEFLRDMAQVLGKDRQAAVCRELTKKFEEVTRGTLGELATAFAERAVKGELVVVVDRPGDVVVQPADIDSALRDALARMKVKDAAALVADMFGLARRDVYQRALKLEVDE